MVSADKVVVRFLNGRILKGIVKDFAADASELRIEDAETGSELKIPIEDVKAVFFVKSYAGDSAHREKKAFGIREDTKNLRRKIYVKFKDGENMHGFVKGDIPWKQGYFVSEPRSSAKGFFVIPTDSESNNIKIFVIGSSILDITVIAP